MKGLIIALLFILISAQAQAATTYTVKKGDTLYGISKKFNISISDLKKMNSNAIKSNKLRIGTILKIDNNKDLNKKTSQETDRPKKYHIVKKGDTIYKISKKYSVSESDIKELNNLRSPKLKIGQKLILSKDSEAVISQTEDPNMSLKKLEQVISEDLDEDKEDLSKMSIKERIVAFAQKMLHIPYKFGGNSLLGIDCSAYVQKVYSKVGIKLPRSAREQFNVGDHVDKEELSIGDLVFFRTYAPFPSHVGIYLGNNLFIHSSSKSKKVTIDSLDAPYYTKRFIGAKRLITDETFDASKLFIEN